MNSYEIKVIIVESNDEAKVQISAESIQAALAEFIEVNQSAVAHVIVGINKVGA